MIYEIIGIAGAMLIAASFFYVVWTVGKSMSK